MSAVVDDIATLIVSLLEGSAGSGRVIPSGRFEHIPETELEQVGAQRLSSRPRPFEIVDLGQDDDGAQPRNLAGSHVYGAQRLVIRAGYAAKKQKVHSLRLEMSKDYYEIRRVLLWAPNRYTVSPWHGTEVLSGSGAISPMASNENEEALALAVSLIVSYREDHDS
jgi:hypothetical protein